MKPFEVGSRTHTRLREANQDVHLVHPVEDGLLLLVCDGMGGGEGGGRAARVCAERVRDEVEGRSSLLEAIQAAHGAVRREAERLDCPGMGTTVAAALVRGGSLEVAWAGDSRVGVLDATGFHWLTRDHSDAPGSSLLTRAVGIGELEPERLDPIELMPGDTVVLCSDGVHSCIEDGELFEILSMHEPEQALDRIELVLDRRAADDNTTTIVYRVDEVWEELPTVEIPKFEEPRPPAPYKPARTPVVMVGVLAVLALLALGFLLLQRSGVAL